jgi:hypothetical protein
MGSYYEGQADKAEGEFAKAQGQEAERWRSALPQATAAVQDKPQVIGGYGAENVVQGPDLAPAKPITREAILKYTLEGLKNPATQREAAIVNQSLTQDLTREEDKTFRDEQARAAAAEREATRAADRQAQMQQALLRSEDTRLSIEQRREAAAEAAQARRDVAAMMAAARRDAAGARGDKLEERKWNDVEKLSRAYGPIAKVVETGQQVQDMLDSYKDPKTGKTVSIPGIGLVVGSLPPGILSTEGSTNRQKIQMFANDMLRAQAGLSQTLTEQERADLEILAKGKFRQDQFVAAWPSLVKKLNAYTKSQAAGFTPEVQELYKKGDPDALRMIGPRTKPTTKQTATSGPVTPAPGGGQWKVEGE